MRNMRNFISSNPIHVLGFGSVIFLLYSRSVMAQEVANQDDFSYVQGSPTGPDRWGTIRTDWADCNNGNMQSPIDLLNNRVVTVQNLGELQMNYNPANAILRNRGHDIMLEWQGNAGSIQINGTTYALRQCHWHSTSEHSVDGRKFALELHLVHQTTDQTVANKIAVVAVMYNTGLTTDPFLAELAVNIALLSKQRREVPVGMRDARRIKVGGGEYYRYLGSLTTPPCTQGVIWTVSKRVNTVTAAEVTALRVAVDDSLNNNARPLQLLNNREIQQYKPQPQAK